MTECLPTSTWALPYESKEWVGPVTVLIDGEPTAVGWKIAVIREGRRPTGFVDPEADPTDPTQLGIRVGPGTSIGVLARGRYLVAVQIGTAADFEEPVVAEAGVLYIE